MFEFLIDNGLKKGVSFTKSQIGLSDGLMLSNNKPLPQPMMLTKIYIDMWLNSYKCVVYVFPSELPWDLSGHNTK